MKNILIAILTMFFSFKIYGLDLLNIETEDIGVTLSHQTVKLGGFSGLNFIGRDSNGDYLLLTITDRGPNAENIKKVRPFLIPEFTPRLIKFSLSKDFSKVSIAEIIPLKSKSGKRISGLPWNSKMEVPVDIFGKQLSFDIDGLDTEGVCISDEKNIWIVDEYGPAICKYDQLGNLLNCLKPGRGLPKKYSKRQLNKGFEGVACLEEKVIAFLQAPIPGEESKGARVAVIDEKSGKFINQFYYPLPKENKIGDASVLNDGSIAVLERDSKVGAKSFKKIFSISFPKNGKTLKKKLILDLATNGFNYSEKAEGFVQLPNGEFVVINDNDFGFEGVPDFITGKVKYSNQLSHMLILK